MAFVGKQLSKLGEAQGLIAELAELHADEDAAVVGGEACHALAATVLEILERDGQHVPLCKLAQEVSVSEVLRQALVPPRAMFDVLKAFLVRSPSLGYQVLSKRVAIDTALQNSTSNQSKAVPRPWQCSWCLRRFAEQDELLVHIAARLAGAAGDREHMFTHCLGLVVATDPGRLPGVSKWHCPICPIRRSGLEPLLEHWSADAKDEHGFLLLLGAALLLRAAPPVEPNSLRHWAEGQDREDNEGLRDLRMFLALARHRRRLAAVEDLSTEALREVLTQRGCSCPIGTQRSELLSTFQINLLEERRALTASVQRRGHQFGRKRGKHRLIKRRRTTANLGSDTESVNSSISGISGEVELDVAVEVVSEVITVSEPVQDIEIL